MANLSNFPQTLDSFTFKTEIQASDVPAISRFQELKLKASRTPTEETELANLTTQLRSKLISADEWNKFSDALVNMEVFITEEITDYVATKQTEINATKDAALILIEQKKENIIAYMDGTTAGAIRNDMGDLTTLTTTDKTSLVKAINENKTSISSLTTTVGTKASTTYVDNAIAAIPAPAAPTWNSVTGKPSTFPPSTHGHAATEITATGSTTVQAEIDSLKSSVSSGKNSVAAAITGKNQTASGTDTFAQLAAKISAISTDATAIAGDILSGKTAYAGSKITGTMVDRGTVNYTPSTVNQTVSGGKHSGSGVVYGDVNLIAANIMSGISIFGVAGTAPKVATGSQAVTGTSATITGLTFQPKFIIIALDYQWNVNLFFYSDGTYMYSGNKGFGTSSATGNITPTASGFSISSFGSGGGNCRWVAIG